MIELLTIAYLGVGYFIWLRYLRSRWGAELSLFEACWLLGVLPPFWGLLLLVVKTAPRSRGDTLCVEVELPFQAPTPPQ